MSEWQNVNTFNGNFGEITLAGHYLGGMDEVEGAARHLNTDADFAPLTQLSGNYAGVVKRQGEVAAFSSLSGQFINCYHYRETGDSAPELLVNSSPSAIAEQIGAGLDRATLGAQVAFPMGLLQEGYTTFEGVREIKSGELIRFSTSTGLRHEIFETFEPDPQGEIDDAIMATRASIHKALERRLDTSCVTADLAGYDSSSLAYKAASMCGKVTAFTLYHPEYPAGDIGLVRRLVKLDPRIDWRELRESDDQFPYSVFSGHVLPFSPDEPYRTASIFGRQLMRVQAARQAGSTMHLTGTGGDALYDSQPFLADLLVRGDEMRFREDSTRLARLDLRRPAFYRQRAYQHANTSLAQAWERFAGVLEDPRKRFSFDIGWLPLLDRNVEWLTPAMRALLKERAQAIADTAHTDMTIGDYNTISQIRDSGNAQRHLMRLEGSAVHAPFLDHQVILAALRCNAYDRTQPGRHYKRVLAEALSGNGVPPQLFERTSKGSYELVDNIGLRRSIAEMAELMRHSRLAALEIINPKAVLEALYNHRSDDCGRVQFSQLMALEVWLRQREEFLGEYIGKLPFSAAAPIMKPPEPEPEAQKMTTKKYVPKSSLVFAAGPAGELLALDTLADNRITLNQTSALVFRALNATGRLEDAVHALAKRYPAAPLARLQKDVADVAAALEAAGFLTQDIKNGRLPLPIPEWEQPILDEESEAAAVARVYEFTPDEQIELTPAEIRIGHQALNVACQLTEQGFVATKQYIEKVQQRATLFATYDEALRYLLIARRLSCDPAYDNHVVACYQLSLAVITMAAAEHKTLDWVMGVTFTGKTEFHAWLEVGNKPVLTSLDTRIEGFRELYRITTRSES